MENRSLLSTLRNFTTLTSLNPEEEKIVLQLMVSIQEIYEKELTMTNKMLKTPAFRYFTQPAPNPFDIKDLKGYTVLIYAVKNNHLAIVLKLIQFNADINLSSRSGYTPLMMAAEKGRTKIVQCLLDAKASPNGQNSSANSALILAVENNHEEIVTKLIHANANLNIQIQWGNSALQIAVQRNYYNIAKLLIEAGAALKYFQENNSLLDSAINSNALPIICLLLFKEVPINNPGKLFDYLTNRCNQGNMAEAEFCLRQLVSLFDKNEEDTTNTLCNETYNKILNYLNTLESIKQAIKPKIFQLLIDATPQNEICTDVLQLVCDYDETLSREMNKPSFFRKMNSFMVESSERKKQNVY